MLHVSGLKPNGFGFLDRNLDTSFSDLFISLKFFFLFFFSYYLGEKKLSKVIVPDKWKDGARNVTEGGGRKINENKLLSKKNRFVSLRFQSYFLPIFHQVEVFMEIAINL